MVCGLYYFMRKQAGHRTCVIDFDIGLRNLDLHLGCERRVIFDFVNVIQVCLLLCLYCPCRRRGRCWTDSPAGSPAVVCYRLVTNLSNGV